MGKKWKKIKKKTHRDVGFQQRAKEEEEVIGGYMESLPPEMIMDILSRVPTLYLAKQRYVCRRWRNILKDPIFRPLHCSLSLSNNDNQVLVLKRRSNELYFVDLTNKTSPREITIKMPYVDDNVLNSELVGSCNGLLCLGNRSLAVFLIVNPFTRQDVFIHWKPCCFASRLGFGFDSVNNLFKVIRICYSSLRVRICDLSRGGVGDWREKKGTTFRLSSIEPACFVNGRLHWTTTHEDDDSLGIISFDLTDEEFKLVPIPHCLRKKRNVDLTAMRGCLCIVLGLCWRLQIWVMKEYGVEGSWVKEFHAKPIIPWCLTSSCRRWHKTLKVLGSVRDGEICFKSTEIKFKNTLFSFDLSCGQFKLLELKMPLGESIIHTASLNWM